MPDLILSRRIAARLALLVACSLMLTLVWAGAAYAHGATEIRATPSQAGPGDRVTIGGEGFQPGSDVAVTLEGAKGVFPVASFKVAADETFEGVATIPDVQPGTYQLKATGADDVAQIDFSVAAPEPTPTTLAPTTTEMPTVTTVSAQATEESVPTTESPPAAVLQPPAEPSAGALTYDRSTTEIVVAGIVLALFVGAALALLLRPARAGGPRS